MSDKFVEAITFFWNDGTATTVRRPTVADVERAKAEIEKHYPDLLLQADTDPRSEGPWEVKRGVTLSGKRFWYVEDTDFRDTSRMTEEQAITVRNALNRDAGRSGR